MSLKGARRTRCSGTKRYMCTIIRMKLIMTREWSPLRIIENESTLAHAGWALQWPLKMRLIETNWVLFSLLEDGVPQKDTIWARWGWSFQVATRNETDWDQLSPSLATAKYGHSKWVHFSPFETHRNQMIPQVAHWVPVRFHSVI